MKRMIFVIILLQIFNVFCYVTPAPVFRLHSVSEDYEKVWIHGKEYSKLTGENTDVIIAFDESIMDIISFDVEVVNYSVEPLLVSSELFTGYYLNKRRKELKENSQVKAIDPEDELLRIDKALSRENARYAQETGNKSLSSFFELVEDVSSIGKAKTKEERERELAENVQQEQQDVNDENYHETVEFKLLTERERWSFNALRKTTLPTDYSVDGKIYFPIISNSHYLKIVFNEGKENINILFKISSFE
jgi:hypothetical protein